jgi:hypothetical protein
MCSVSSFFWSEMSWKIAVAEASAVGSAAAVAVTVVLSPMGNEPPSCETAPSARGAHARRPRAPGSARAPARPRRRAQFAPHVLVEAEAEQRRRGGVRVEQRAARVDGDDAAADVAQDVARLEAGLVELRDQLFGPGARLAEAGADVAGGERDGREDPELQPEGDAVGEGRPEQRAGEVEHAPQRCDERDVLVDSSSDAYDREDVEGGELRRFHPGDRTTPSPRAGRRPPAR